ncbi:L1 transposable element RBD-like domain [Branchiostoma belcheri]|nr:L1 transposable element RBD-like domain [Branchiostoma belcheri]
MGKRHRGSRGSHTGSSSEENTNTPTRPPPKSAKMASGGEVYLTSLPTELKNLAQLILARTKEQQETTVERLSVKIDALDTKLCNLSAELSTVRERVNAVETTAEYHASEILNLQKALGEERRARAKAVILAERYSRKADVVIRGIPFQKDEICTQILDEFLTKELHLDIKPPIVAVHRLSRPSTTRPNPALLVRFVNFHDRDKVLFEGRKLRGKGMAVYEHLPPPLQTARAKLVPERDEAMKRNDKASIVVPRKSTCAVLFVNDKEKRSIDAVDILLNFEEKNSVGQ